MNGLSYNCRNIPISDNRVLEDRLLCVVCYIFTFLLFVEAQRYREDKSDVWDTGDTTAF